MEPKAKIPSYKKHTRKDIKSKQVEDSMWGEQRAWLPKRTAKMIDEMAAKTGMPKARITAYIIDNALTQVESPFEMFIPTLKAGHVENEFAHEAKLLYDFLKVQTKPFGIDLLMMFRRDIGVIDKYRLVGAYYELLDADMIEEKYPHGHSFQFPADYKVAAVKSKRYR